MDPLWNNYRPLFGRTPQTDNYSHCSATARLCQQRLLLVLKTGYSANRDEATTGGLDILPTSDYPQLGRFERAFRLQLPEQGNSYELVKWQF